MKDIWEEEFPEFSSRPDIFWTVYNTGKTTAHPNPIGGVYSKEAEEIYNRYYGRYGT